MTDKKEEKPLYIIVDHVLHSIAKKNNLNLVESCLLALIDRYSKKQGARATNEKYSEILLVSIPTIHRALDVLEEKNLITRTYSDETKRNRSSIKTNLDVYETEYQNDTHDLRVSKRDTPCIKLIDTEYQNDMPYNRSNIINNSLNNKDEKLSKLINTYFNIESDNGSGRLSLKKYPNIYLKTNELETIIELYKNNGLSKSEYNLIFSKCQNEMEMKHRDFRAKGGLAYKYLTGYLMEEALKLKKVAPRANLEVRHNYNSQPIPNNIKNIINKAGIK